jgi:ADP-ribose pyrophosphatase YjhB (NUDIX family)
MKVKRKTKPPIASYGIILFCIVEKTPKFLIQQRRDSYEYMDILRGNWSNEIRLKELFSALSQEEKERLGKYSFTELWDDLWVVHGAGLHAEGLEKAKRKFSIIKEKYNLFVKNADNQCLEPPWGFPKGKKNKGEKEVDCAFREFEEETRLKKTDIKLCNGVGLFAEFYKGNNGKMYCTHYYLAEAEKMIDIERIDTPNCIRKSSVSDEVSDARWMTFEEASEKLASRRRNILKNIIHLIDTAYEKFSPYGKL